MDLAVCPTCVLCELHESCRTVCMPTRLGRLAAGKRRQALLVVGTKPSRGDDRSKLPFSGRAGDCWEDVYQRSMGDVLGDVDVYLTNAVRCYPGADKIKPKHIKACRQYLDQDVAALSEQYGGRLIILALGSEACHQVFGEGVAKALRRQGEHIEFPFVGPVPCCATFHPNFIDGNPSQRSQQAHLVKSVGGHLQLLVRILRGEEIRTAWDGSQLKVNVYPGDIFDD